MKDEFVETFGRPPGKDDPVFIQQFYVSEADLQRQTLQAMKAAGTPFPLVHAYKRTGRILSKEGRELLTPVELQEWDDAIKEYYDAVESGEEFDMYEDGDGLLDFLNDALRKNQIVGGLFLDRHFNNYKNRNVSIADVEAFVAFSVTNFVRTLRSIHILIDQGAAYEAYHLARVLYENYLAAAYVYKFSNAAEIFFAQLGIIAGTHEFARAKSGAVIRSQIMELSTGNKITVPSRKAMSSEIGPLDEEIYDVLYRSLSSHIHSEVTNMQWVISDRGFSYFNHDPSIDVLANSHLICLLFFCCLKKHSPCLKVLKGDLSVVAERSLFSLLMVRQELAEQGRQMPPIYGVVINSLSASDSQLAKILSVTEAAAASNSAP